MGAGGKVPGGQPWGGPHTPPRGSVPVPGLRSAPPWDTEAKTTGSFGRPRCWLRESREPRWAAGEMNDETHENKNGATNSDFAHTPGTGLASPWWVPQQGGISLSVLQGLGRQSRGTRLVKHEDRDFNSHRSDSGIQPLSESAGFIVSESRKHCGWQLAGPWQVGRKPVAADGGWGMDGALRRSHGDLGKRLGRSTHRNKRAWPEPSGGQQEFLP